MKAIKEAIGQSSVFDYYDISKETLGKGSFASVHAGVHKKTGKVVAIKILSKKNLDPDYIENCHRELDMMKIC